MLVDPNGEPAVGDGSPYSAGALRKYAPFCLTFASAASILVSIAVSQILMGAALIAVLATDRKLRWPAVKLPLALFFAATLVAVALSPDPMSGLPQVRKFFVFAMLPLVFTTFENLHQIRALIFAWGGIGALSAGRSLLQFFDRRYEALHQNANTYDFYLDGRITGFASHWMTFGGEEMIVCILLVAVVLFAADRRSRIIAGVLSPVICIALVLGLTRSIFMLGLPVGLIYLFWNWKRTAILAVPAAAAAVMTITPFYVRERALSVLRPHGSLDSNTHRSVTRRTGWEMVKAHPWFGLGPEQIKPSFMQHVPPDIPRPLPHGWYGHLHNVYLQYAAERGVPALVFVIWFIGKTLFDFVRSASRQGRASSRVYVLHGAVAAILAVLAAGWFEYNLGDSEVLTMFLAVIACGYVFGKETPLAQDQVTAVQVTAASCA